MKVSNKFIVAAFLLIANLQAFATIWQVNNIVGVYSNFTSLQAAYNAASSGDTLYIYGSSTGYGDLSMTKPLTLIGPGYYLSQNPQTQSNYTPASINVLYFRPNSGGSVVMGLTIGQISCKTSNITIRRNMLLNGVQVSDSSLSNNSNIIVSQNYIAGGCVQTYSGIVSNVTVSNNIIVGCISLNTGSNYTVLNNYISGTVYMNNGTFKNNIHSNYNINTGSTSSTFTNTVVQNNVFSGRTLSNGSVEIAIDTPANKINFTSLSLVFTQTGSNDGKYQLKTGSPAIGFAYGGGDCGPFGSGSPYILSGMPNIPSVYEFIVPPAGGSNLSITIKAKSHQ